MAVSTGMVSFSLGMDTAGSGRVPAAFNNIIGLKPTRGLLSGWACCRACRDFVGNVLIRISLVFTIF